MKNEKIIYENLINSDELVSPCIPVLEENVACAGILKNGFDSVTWVACDYINSSCHNSITFTEQAVYSHFLMVHFYLCIWQFTRDE